MNLFKKADLVQHNKTQTIYVIIFAPDQLRVEASGQPGYAYIKHDDPNSTVWVREQTLMEDGRFSLVGAHNPG